jgi:amino acid transporter
MAAAGRRAAGLRLRRGTIRRTRIFGIPNALRRRRRWTAAPPAFGKIHPRWNTPHVSILTLGLLASVLLIVMQIGDTVRAAYDTIVSLMVIVGFIPFVYIFVYIFGSAWNAGHRWSAASGWGVTLLAILCTCVPPGGITHVWIFEGKLAIGTLAGIVSAWGYLLAATRKAADNSPNVISPG